MMWLMALLPRFCCWELLLNAFKSLLFLLLLLLSPLQIQATADADDDDNNIDYTLLRMNEWMTCKGRICGSPCAGS